MSYNQYSKAIKVSNRPNLKSERLLLGQISDLQIEIKHLQKVIESKDKEIEDLKYFPDKKGLNKLVRDFVNGETLQQSIDRIMKDDSDIPIRYAGSDVSELLQQITGN